MLQATQSKPGVKDQSKVGERAEGDDGDLSGV